MGIPNLTDRDMEEFSTKFKATPDRITEFLAKNKTTAPVSFCSHVSHPIRPDEEVYYYDGESENLETAYCNDPKCFLVALGKESIAPDAFDGNTTFGGALRQKFHCVTCGNSNTYKSKMKKCLSSGHDVKFYPARPADKQDSKTADKPDSSARKPDKPKGSRTAHGGSGDDDKLSHTDYARMIMLNHHFVTLFDTKEILYYEGGIFRNGGDVIIEAEAERMVEECDLNMERQIIGTIRRNTYHKRDEFDANPMLLNVRNGIIDLETMKLQPHTPLTLFRTQIDTKYDADATAENFEKFIGSVLDSERDRTMLYEIVASAMLRSHLNLEKAVMLVGQGGNGKSTLLSAIMAVFGDDVVSPVSIHDLLYKRFSRSSLDGKMLNIFPDITSQDLENMGILKAIITGEKMEVEKKNVKGFNIRPYAVHLFSANLLPEVSEDTDAVYRRFVIINFRKPVAEGDRNRLLLASLTTEEEKSGMLNILLHHAKTLLKNKRLTYEPTPEEVRAEWHDQADHVSMFITERIERESKHSEDKSDMFAAYVEFCQGQHHVAYSQQAFTQRMKQKGLKDKMVKKDGKTRRAWIDVRLKESDKSPGGGSPAGGSAGKEGDTPADETDGKPETAKAGLPGITADDLPKLPDGSEPEAYVCMECSAGPWLNDGNPDLMPILRWHMRETCRLLPSDKRGNQIE